ncbi:MAG: signal peptidase I [bacterium]
MSDNPFLGGNVKERKDIITDFLQTIVLALAFSLILYLVFLVPSVVDGSSMEPNFYDKELLFANKTIQWLGPTSIGQKLKYDYKRGDVIIFQSGERNLIKRVIATAGDTVKLKDNQVFINGKLLVEEYLPANIQTEVPEYGLANFEANQTTRVPEGTYFVMGDNRKVSQDSRYAIVGFVPRAKIRGKVFFRYWPINRFTLIGSGKYLEQ